MSHNFSVENLFDSFFGGGFDGDITVTGNTTLSADRHYNNVTVKSGGNLSTNGYRLYVKNLLKIESGGVVQYNAPASVGRVSGGAYGFFGTMTSYPTYGAFGLSGSEGGAVNKAGIIPSSQLAQQRPAGAHATSSVGWGGGKGGDATLSGGNGGAGGYTFTHWGSLRTFPQCITFKPNGLFYGISFGSGPGGGGGACDAGGVNDWSGAGGHGGAGVGIVCYEIVNDGSIECKGGNGGNAAGAVKAGGGGGGAGGVICITTRLATKIGTLDVSGGVGGTGINGGGTGSTGQSGQTQVVII